MSPKSVLQRHTQVIQNMQYCHGDGADAHTHIVTPYSAYMESIRNGTYSRLLLSASKVIVMKVTS